MLLFVTYEPISTLSTMAMECDKNCHTFPHNLSLNLRPSPPITQIKSDSFLRFFCLPTTPRYHDDTMVNYDQENGFSVSLLPTPPSSSAVNSKPHHSSAINSLDLDKLPILTDNGLSHAVLVTPSTSVLTIREVNLKHAGNYTCAPSNAKFASITVHVLRGEFDCWLWLDHMVVTIKFHERTEVSDDLCCRDYLFLSLFQANDQPPCSTPIVATPMPSIQKRPHLWPTCSPTCSSPWPPGWCWTVEWPFVIAPIVHRVPQSCRQIKT